MPASPSVDLASRIPFRAPGGPPEAWRAADGWLGAGVVLLAAGAAGTVASVWARLAPATRPVPDRLVPLAAGLALAEVAVGGASALRHGGQARVWRGLTITAAALGAMWCDPAGWHARLWVPWLLVAAVLGLAMRAGELMAATVARALLAMPPAAGPLRVAIAAFRARALRAPREGPGTAAPGGGSAVAADAASAGTDGEGAIRTTWRLVAEVWLLAAGAAAIGGAGPPYRLPAAAAAMGGAILLVGAQVTVLQASWARRGFAVDGRPVRAHWGLGLAVAAALTGLLLAVPLPGALLLPSAVRAGLLALGHAALPAHATLPPAAAYIATPPAAPDHSGGLDLAAALLAIVDALVAEFFGSILALLAAVPLVLPLVLAAAVLAALVLRFPRETRDLLRRLLAVLSALLAFWSQMRLPGRNRRALAGLAPPRRPARAGRAGVGLRLWALLDPRAAVRATYRRFLREMAEAGSPRQAHASPRAYARELQRAGGPAPPLDDITTAYELARYSDHLPERGWVGMARLGLAAVRRRRR